MRIAVVWFAIAGVLLGGAVSFALQRKPVWMPLLLLVTAALTVWWGVINVQAVS